MKAELLRIGAWAALPLAMGSFLVTPVPVDAQTLSRPARISLAPVSDACAELVRVSESAGALQDQETQFDDGNQGSTAPGPIADNNDAPIDILDFDGNGNEGDLDDEDIDNEIRDLQASVRDEGCVLRAIVTDRNGRRVGGEQVTLRRSAAVTQESENFGRPRTTNTRGVASWKFQPEEDSNYTYVVTSSGRRPARSNEVTIPFCTGTGDDGASRGCDDFDDGNDNSDDDDLEDELDDIVD